jgi:hypothetical protein
MRIGFGAYPGEEELSRGDASGVVRGGRDPRVTGATKLRGDAGAPDDVGEKV